jgi:hypothetical protein
VRTERRNAHHEEVRSAAQRLGHEREAPIKAEPIRHPSRCSARKQIARDMHRAKIIADCAAKDGCFRRGDAHEHVAPADNTGTAAADPPKPRISMPTTLNPPSAHFHWISHPEP